VEGKRDKLVFALPGKTPREGGGKGVKEGEINRLTANHDLREGQKRGGRREGGLC